MIDFSQKTLMDGIHDGNFCAICNAPISPSWKDEIQWLRQRLTDVEKLKDTAIDENKRLETELMLVHTGRHKIALLLTAENKNLKSQLDDSQNELIRLRTENERLRRVVKQTKNKLEDIVWTGGAYLGRAKWLHTSYELKEVIEGLNKTSSKP